ncbi:MAG: hypothetical protein ACRCVD_06520, partial [Halioglobus sp.]
MRNTTAALARNLAVIAGRKPDARSTPAGRARAKAAAGSRRPAARPRAPAGLWRRVFAPLLRITLGVVVLGGTLALAVLAHDEMRNGTLQSRWLADFAAGIDYQVEPGAAREPVIPD